MWLSAVIGAAVRRGRRVPRRGFNQLTSKIGPIGYYKGKGGPPAGRHTSKGKYVIQPWKLMSVRLPPEGKKSGQIKPYVGHV